MAVACGLRSAAAIKLRPRSSTSRPLGELGRGVERRTHDAGIAGAAAKMTSEHDADLFFGRRRVAREIVVERHENARRAIAALKRMMPAEGELQDREPIATPEAFDRLDAVPFGL